MAKFIKEFFKYTLFLKETQQQQQKKTISQTQSGIIFFFFKYTIWNNEAQKQKWKEKVKGNAKKDFFTRKRKNNAKKKKRKKNLWKRSLPKEKKKKSKIKDIKDIQNQKNKKSTKILYHRPELLKQFNFYYSLLFLFGSLVRQEWVWKFIFSFGFKEHDLILEILIKVQNFFLITLSISGAYTEFLTEPRNTLVLKQEDSQFQNDRSEGQILHWPKRDKNISNENCSLHNPKNKRFAQVWKVLEFWFLPWISLISIITLKIL